MEKLIEELSDLLKSFFTETPLKKLIPYLTLILLALYFILFPILKYFVKAVQKYLLLKFNYSSLRPFFSKEEIKDSRRYFIDTQCQDISPAHEVEPIFGNAFAVREDLISKFIKKIFKSDYDNDKYYFILADSGMGKTTFLINLYKKYKNNIFRKYDIKLFPLGWPGIDTNIKQISPTNAMKTILLLDALDEDPAARENYIYRLKELEQRFFLFKQVIITCRSQFFPSEQQEPSDTTIGKYGPKKGLYKYNKLYISPFSNNDIKKYLNKVFQIWELPKKRKAERLINNSKFLMIRPFLLSHIKDLIRQNENLEYTNKVYAVLIAKWIDREASRIPDPEKEAFKIQLYELSIQIALDLYYNEDTRGGFLIDERDLTMIAINNNIQLSSLELKSRSLLNRNATKYKFAHKSILEYFLAIKAFESKEFANTLNFFGLEQSELFLNELCCERVTLPFLNKQIFNYPDINSSIMREILSLLKNKFGEKIYAVNEMNKVAIIIDANTEENVFRGMHAVEHLAILILSEIDFSFFKHLKKLTTITIFNEAKNFKENIFLYRNVQNDDLESRIIELRNLNYLVREKKEERIVAIDKEKINQTYLEQLNHEYFTRFIQNTKSKISKYLPNIIYQPSATI